MMPANSNPDRPRLPLSQPRSPAPGRLSQRRSRQLPLLSVGCVGLLLFFWNLAALAEQTPPTGDTTAMLTELKVAIDTLWVMLAGMLVIFMNAGFAMLETGFCRQKNAVNVLAKNLIVFALSTIAFWVCGFGLMFSNSNGFLGSGGFFLAGVDNSPATGDAYQGIFSSLDWAGVPLLAKFFFQLAFAGTAATIVSGAVAERIKFKVFLIFSLLLVAIAYPITGHWVWGGGWLAGLGFYDFAGSTVVHSVGGWAALVGALTLGPRIGKYRENGQPNALPAHNMAISTLGCLILWLGWFGFNPGSTMAVSWHIAHIAVTTNTAAAFGGVAATLTAWVIFGNPDLSMIINGILAGLVAITASCAFVPIWAAALIGIGAGILVVFSVLFFEKRQVDDPVGAVSVHMVNGVWGTIAVGLFAVGPGVTVGTGVLYEAGGGPSAGLLMGGGLEQLGIQLLGVVSVALTIMTITAAFWTLLKFTVGIRVPAEEELQGLDLYEHGIEAYSGFLKEPDSLTTGAPK